MNTEKPLIAPCFGLAACAGQPTIPNSTPAVPTVRATQVPPEMIKNGERVGYKPQLAHGEVTSLSACNAGALAYLTTFLH